MSKATSGVFSPRVVPAYHYAHAGYSLHPNSVDARKQPALKSFTHDN
jgi:hypothetical protein